MSYARPPWFRWWLFPATGVFHFAEELFAGGAFYTWVASIDGARVSMTGFASATLLALVSITAASWAIRKRRYDWLLFALAATILTNALTHAVGSLTTHSYSPLGGAILYHAGVQKRGAVWYFSLLLGTAVNFVVLLLTMNLGRILAITTILFISASNIPGMR